LWVGGNYVIGTVIFLVLIAIQYVVINHARAHQRGHRGGSHWTRSRNRCRSIAI